MNGAPLPCVTTVGDDDEYRAYVTVIPGSLLYRMYDDHGAACFSEMSAHSSKPRGR